MTRSCKPPCANRHHAWQALTALLRHRYCYQPVERLVPLTGLVGQLRGVIAQARRRFGGLQGATVEPVAAAAKKKKRKKKKKKSKERKSKRGEL